MCEICTSEGKDYRFANGAKSDLVKGRLYRVFKDSVAPIHLCYLHDLELFALGEKRFLKEHLSFSRGIWEQAKKKILEREKSESGI